MFSQVGPLLLNLLTIILINLVLSGDNAVMIALAVKTLPYGQRMRALIAGAACAVFLRVAATAFAGQLLHVAFVKLIGGITILWIAVKLFPQAVPSEALPGGRPSSFWRAIWFILLADITMSLDNILAIAEGEQGDVALLVIGLGLSIPFVLFASGLLAALMDKYPVIVYLGAALFGKIGAEMLLTDRFTAQVFSPAPLFRYAVEATAAVTVLLAGKLLLGRAVRAPASACEL
jgi:YjbE family integral membrane protein